MTDHHNIVRIDRPQTTSAYDNLSVNFDELSSNLADLIRSAAEKPEYLPWEKIKYKDWARDHDPTMLWQQIKLSRKVRAQKTPITSPDQQAFYWTRCEHYDEILHGFTRTLSGHTIGLPQIVSEKEKRQYITRGLIEEAIASSQLEGANTTRKYAKKMIQENLPPRDKSQRMIINNYQTMQKIEHHFKNEELSVALLHAIHRELTKNDTLDQGLPGTLRKDEDDIYINGPDNDGQIAYVPPAMDFVDQELPKLIAFANDKLPSPFVHPVIKAIMLHFWIGFLHPYGDGNGRLARALFYWYLLRNDYWAFAFLPISEAIKKSPKQYGWAYIYSEQDDNDLTYFLDYNLRKILQAQKSFEGYILKKKNETEQIKEALRSLKSFNTRQAQIMNFLYSNPGDTTNVSAVAKIFGVSDMTAVRDLRELCAKNYLTKEKKGRNVFYHPTQKLFDLFLARVRTH